MKCRFFLRYFLAFMLYFSGMCKVTSFHMFHRKAGTYGHQMGAALTSAVFRKTLSLSGAARARYTTGEITNFVAIDAARFQPFALDAHMLWAGPLMLALSVTFLYDLVGVSAFAGLAVLALCVPINAVASRINKRAQVI